MDTKNREDRPIDLPTDLAISRTLLAAERTLMSWIRTSLALISFGFTIIKFFEYLKGEITPSSEHLSGSTKLGALLILLGTFSIIPAIFEHRRELNQLNKLDPTSPRWSYAMIVAILVGIVGVYALVDSVAMKFFT